MKQRDALSLFVSNFVEGARKLEGIGIE